MNENQKPKKVKYVKIDESAYQNDEPLSTINKPVTTGKKKKTEKKTVKNVLSVIGTTFLSLMLIVVITGCIVVTALTVYVMQFAENTFDIDLKNVELSYTSFIYANDADGNQVEIKRLSTDENRIWADIEDIPQCVQDAFVAVEDQRFFEHEGVDWKRTVAVTIATMFSGYGEGGSTITQQLIKNITGDDRVSPERKLREIFRALSLESKYTKIDILEAYLNRIPLGGTVYGVGSAAYHYFGKSISDLTIAEAAILAGITRSPSVLNPYADLQASKDRQTYALGCMYEQGLITTDEYEAAKVEQVKFRLIIDGDAYGYVDERYEEYYGNTDTSENTETTDNTNTNTETGEPLYDDVDNYEAYKWDEYELSQNWYVDAAINQVIEDLAEQKGITYDEARSDLYQGGYKIYLNMNMALQDTIEKKFSDPNIFVYSYDKTAQSEDLLQAAFVLMDYHGRVVACAGGIGDKPGDSCFNRATQAILPIGSTMKPISVYGLAVEKNLITYSSMAYDYPIDIDNGDGTTSKWPLNYANEGGGGAYMPIWQAVQLSRNTIAVRVCQLNTIEECFNFLTSKLGITSLTSSDMAYSPIALGQLSEGMTLTQLCAAYQIFGNGGVYYKPMYYSKVCDYNDKPVLEQDAIGTQAISSDSAYITNRLMATVINSPTGSGRHAKLGNVEVVGKTGTSNDERILAFMGLTPEYVGAYRIGFDDNKMITNEAWNTPAAVWADIMDDFIDTTKTQTFTPDPNVVQLEYCTETGLLATSNCPNKAIGYYKKDNLPATCDSTHDGTYVKTHSGETLFRTDVQTPATTTAQ